MTDNNPTSIQAYQKKWHMNIGVVIFGIIFVYLAVTVLMYLTENHISAYEVREGSILRDNAYTGFILRDEVVMPAEADGYVNYYALGNSKAGAKTKVYTLSDRELVFTDTSSEEARKLTAEEQAALMVKIQAFSENFQEGQFGDVYTLKDYMFSVLDSRSSQNRQAQLDAMAGQEGSGLQIYSAASDGIIVYSTDGYENFTVNDITEEIFVRNNYTKKELKDNAKVRAGDPVYKLIRDDSWSIVIPLDKEIIKEMADLKSVRIRFAKDHETAVAGFSIHTAGDMHLGVLALNSSMIRYAEERYLDLELILEDESGLKIPKSSVTDKKFYIIQEDYLTQGGNTKETGVLVETGKENPEFRKVNVYDRDQESGMVYLNTDAFDEDTILVKPDSQDTCVLNKTKSIKGVYNINKGYAIFKQVHILCESDDYYIVESGSDYGLSNYDHIALNGENVKENDVVF